MEMETENIGQLEIHPKGQSLVEMAIIVPLLMFFMIGIFEVGIAIRTYLVLVNANREIARYAVRPDYLKPNEGNYQDIGYQNVLDRAYKTVGNQVFIDFEENSALIVNIIQVDTGFPCDPAERIIPDPPLAPPDYWPNCDCDLVATQPYTPYVITNSLVSPNYGFNMPISVTSRFDIEALSLEIAANNDVFNCKAMKRTQGGLYPEQMEVVVVEIFYDHHQVFGFPLISNPFTDPITLYTHTTMRRMSQRRSPYEGGQFK